MTNERRQELKNGMLACLDDTDEQSHMIADEILCEICKDSGYKDIVDVYNKIEKWYE